MGTGEASVAPGCGTREASAPITGEGREGAGGPGESEGSWYRLTAWDNTPRPKREGPCFLDASCWRRIRCVPACGRGLPRRPMAWTRSVPCSACCTAAPSSNRIAGSMPCSTGRPRRHPGKGLGRGRANRGRPAGLGSHPGCRGVRGGSLLADLAAALKAGTYRPAPLRRVHLPKPGQPGTTRPLGIPTVRDRWR